MREKIRAAVFKYEKEIEELLDKILNDINSDKLKNEITQEAIFSILVSEFRFEIAKAVTRRVISERNRKKKNHQISWFNKKEKLDNKMVDMK